MGYVDESVYAVITVVFLPGIVAHEVAHLLACRGSGVAVREGISIAFTTDSVGIEHEPVDSFWADLAIAVAPFALNSAFAFVALAGAHAAGVPWSLVFLWLGVCLAFTALPSGPDTETLYETAAELSGATRLLAYALAAPLRTLTRLPLVPGVATFGWFLVLYGVAGRVGPWVAGGW